MAWELGLTPTSIGPLITLDNLGTVVDRWNEWGRIHRHCAMATIRHPKTLPTTEARAKLSQIASEFERQGASAEPVTFGSHRRPQGVIIPWALWLEILPAIEDRLDTNEARQRLDEAGSDRLGFDDVAAALGRDSGRYR